MKGFNQGEFNIPPTKRKVVHKAPPQVRLKTLGFLFCLIMTVSVKAQSILKGTVTDRDSQKPISGATVTIKGTKSGTLSSEDGSFELTATKGAIINITAIGYEPSAILYNNQKQLKIRLKPASSSLEDVQVTTALGIVRDKRELGYSTQTIKGEDLTEAQSGNWTDALVGKVAGLDMVRSNSGPGGSNKIILRGENNLTGDNEALIVLDGVVLNSAKRNGTTEGEAVYGTGSDNMPADYGSNLGDLNPDDFDKVDILDGPNAAALYGQRGANGAIVITTKSGKNKPMTITFRSNANIQQVNRWPDLQYEYGQGLDGADYYSFGAGNGLSSTSATSSAYGPKFDGQYFYQYNPLLHGRDSVPTLWRPYKNQTRDYFEDGSTITNSLSVSGGKGKTTSRFSYNNTHNNWIIPNTGYNQNSVSMSFNTDFNDKLQVATQLMYNNKKSDNLPGAGYGNQSIMYWYIFWQPNADMNWLKDYWLPGEENKKIFYPFSSYPENPYAVANEFINRMQRNAVTGNVRATYKVTPDLSLQARTSIDLSYEQRAQERPWDAGTKMPKGSYREQNIASIEKAADITATYTKELNENYGINFMVGGSVLRDNYTRDQVRVDSLKYPGIYSFANAAGVRTTFPYRSEYAINSLYGLLSGHYKNFLYLDFSAREDWNSTLATPNRTTNAGFFYPSASASFILSDAVKLPEWINYAKVRFSAAGVGSGGTNPYLTAYNYTSAGAAFEGGLQNPSSLPNSELKPLKTITYETGFNLSMLNDRLNLDLTLYTGNTRNQILSRIIDRASGYTSAVINAGQINNKGIEFTMRATPVKTTDFNWNTTVIFSANKNTITQLLDSNVVLFNGPTGGTQIIAKPGGSMGDLYGIGYQRSPDGQVIYDETTGFAKLTTDLVYLGNTTPKGRVSWGNKFAYKRFSVNFLFDAQYGGKGYSLTAYKLAEQGKTKNTLPGRYNGIIGKGVIQNPDGSYRPNDVIATDIDEFYRSMYGANNGEGATYSTDFIKFREATITYTLGAKFTKRLGLQKLSIGLYGRDLFIWSPWPVFDPEFGTLSGTDIIKGFEIGQFPSTRSFGANLNIAF